ncbi:SPOR domain-containing protein [Malaciobacter marinus]|uniref:SPOR domain-containing protein n=1 Tax=Malaciobacter marinus TaxID=505249 RepID=UPI003B00F327
MEIKGEDFLKKVQKKQETEELEQRLSQLKGDEEDVQTNQQYYSKPNMQDDDAVKVDIDDQELGDIMLNGASNNSGQSNETNKRKYLILGLVLIILFLLTIVIIRLLNSPSDDDSFSNTQEKTNEEKSLENDSIEQQYQKIIDEKLKNIKEQTNQTEEVNTEDSELNIDSIEQKEKKVEEEAAKPDVFGIKKEQEEAKKEVIKKVTKPVVKKQEVKKQKTTKTVKKSTNTSKPKGTFVQVGAFSKQPAKKYLEKIEKNGFNYTIYKVTVNGKVYNKVLVGPYNNRTKAEENMSIIKRKLNISSAFILRF